MTRNYIHTLRRRLKEARRAKKRGEHPKTDPAVLRDLIRKWKSIYGTELPCEY